MTDDAYGNTNRHGDHFAQLAAREAAIVLASFEPADAWTLGTTMVERALAAGSAVIIEIRRPTLVLFRAALAGTTQDNEAWLERKARTVLRFELSTAALGARFAAQGVDPWSASWFDTDRYTVAGGSVPIRVRGAGVVGALTVSGLTSDEDHELACAALENLQTAQTAQSTQNAHSTQKNEEHP